MFFRRDRDLDDAERAVIAEVLPHWARLDVDERSRLGTIATQLLDRVSWEPARGFAIDERMRITIAAHAALLAVGLPDPVFRNVRAVVVHPTTITSTGSRPGPIPGTLDDRPIPLLGHTSAHGPVVIAWDSAKHQARHPERGHNVVFHEFAHKLDVEDGSVDGTPRLADAEQRARWVEVCQRAYGELRAGRGSGLLRDYAATTPGEFFAVVTEVFFDLGQDLRELHPDLYDVLRDFYRQDPAAR